jgi:hypothetical protein
MVAPLAFAVQSAATGNRDLYWPTLIQAVGTFVLVIATGGLVWATSLLVRVTKRLSIVGEQTWKSSVVPTVWVFRRDGKITGREEAFLNVRNACAIELTRVDYMLNSTAFIIDSKSLYVNDRMTAGHIERFDDSGELGSFDTSGEEKQINFWKVAIDALNYRRNNMDEFANLENGHTIVPGFIASIRFVHSVTNQHFTKFVRYRVEEIGPGTISANKINEGEARPLT